LPRGSTQITATLPRRVCALRGRRMAVALERLSGLGFSQQNHSLDKIKAQRPRQVRLLAAAGGVYARVVAAAGTQLPAPHLEDLKKRFSRWQKRVVADALRRRSSGA
jgi:hypothetical protein